MRKTPLKRISAKKQKQIEEEYPIRVQLSERCGGVWVRTGKFWGHSNGGYCEICGKAGGHTDFDRLYPHEKMFRSRGGKLSLENSVMAHNWCQAEFGHNIKIVKSEPRWSNGDKKCLK